jgi:hypothetical protein
VSYCSFPSADPVTSVEHYLPRTMKIQDPAALLLTFEAAL